MRSKEWRDVLRTIALLLFAVIAIPVGLVAGFLVITTTTKVVVEECISVSETTFTLNVKPKETHVQTFTVTNTSTEPIEVTFTHTVDPPPVGDPKKDLTISFDPPNPVTVPGSSSISVDMTVQAGQSQKPGTYTISIGWNR